MCISAGFTSKIQDSYQRTKIRIKESRFVWRIQDMYIYCTDQRLVSNIKLVLKAQDFLQFTKIQSSNHNPRIISKIQDSQK